MNIKNKPQTNVESIQIPTYHPYIFSGCAQQWPSPYAGVNAVAFPGTLGRPNR